MKLYGLIPLFFCIISYGQNQKKISLTKSSLNLVDSSIYILGRGTKTKSKQIAEVYNISNKCITHVGLGIYINNKLTCWRS